MHLFTYTFTGAEILEIKNNINQQVFPNSCGYLEKIPHLVEFLLNKYSQSAFSATAFPHLNLTPEP